MVYKNTFSVYEELNKVAKDIAIKTKKEITKKSKTDIAFEYRNRNDFTCELKFAGDLLVMTMHTNIFQFPRDHAIMKTPYIKEDPLRSYCGIINMYNFLADSFKYDRINDVGYLVARIFINKEFHYFVEGKRQIGLYYNNFINESINKDALKKILETAILYCIDFDLLTPPYDNVKEATVQEMQDDQTVLSIKTGKRLGFRFQADHDEAHPAL